MRLLLDTQIALWGLTNDPRLTMKAKELILDANSVIYICGFNLGN